MDKVGTASVDLSGQMDQINQSARQASDAASSTAAAIEELAVSVDHISQSSRQTESSAMHATQLADHGGQLAHRASEEIQRVAGQIGPGFRTHCRSGRVLVSKDKSSDDSYHVGVLSESRRDMLLFLAELTEFNQALDEIGYLESNELERSKMIEQLADTIRS